MIPESATQLLITFLFVVPGFVFQGARIAHRGRLPGDIDLSTRIMRAIATSGVFGLVYLLVLGRWLVQAVNGTGPLIDRPRLGALVGLVAAFVLPSVIAVVPALVGLVLRKMAARPRMQSVLNWGPIRAVARIHSSLSTALSYDSTPAAWDKVFRDQEPCFVRILTTDGRWIAGYYGSTSYASSFPEERQLFLEALYQVSSDGVIGEPVEDGLGAVIRCDDIVFLELLAAPEDGART